MQDHTKLRAFELADEVAVLIYRITRGFPREEIYGLTSQMRRAAVSLTSNIAEGFSRQSQREKVQFYSMAKSSLTELQNQLLIARDIGYTEKDNFTKLSNISVETSKLSNGLIRTIKNRP